MKLSRTITRTILTTLILTACTPPSPGTPAASPTITASPTPPTPSATPTLTPSPVPSPTPNPLFAEMASLRGVNFGNALDAPAPGAWGVTLTRELVLAVRDAGFNAIRLPVRFSAHTGPAPEYTLDPDFLATVDEVIGWVLDAGLTVLLDLHHFEALNQNPAAERDHFLSIWDQLARHYQSQPEQLYFELLNEPSGELDADTWNVLLRDALAVVRQSNPDRVVLVSTAAFAAVDALDQLSLPRDTRLAATFHYYEPFEFTHQGANWVSGSSAWLGTTWDGTAEEEDAISSAFDQARAWSTAQNVPLVLGEFGAIEQADHDSRVRWTAAVARAAKRTGMAWFHWDLCTDFGIYDCDAGVWDPDLLSALLD
ncbi:glycoside hydrolase family 5 protein [bacterium]|nr:glycoside hydrolase family 5 protein [bacterium]